MNGIRVAIVTHRFWPLAGHAEQAVANLAQGLLQQGVQPSIITARFDARWPTELVFREIPVHRLPCPQRFGWGTMRYMIALSRWLRRNRPDIDLVCVSRLSHDAHSSLGALAGTGIPVVLRAEADESLKTSRLPPRIVRRCQGAAALVAAGQASQAELVSAGFDPQRIHVIPDGVAAAAPCTLEQRMAARAALAAVNEDLRVGFKMPVASFIGPLQAEYELEKLVDAWKIVAQDWPEARLWLIGDGAQRERLYRRIRSADLHGRVLMPGTFDCHEDVIRASNVLIVSPQMAGPSFAMMDALAAGVPVLTANRPDASGSDADPLITDGVTGRVVAGLGPQALADAIQQTFADLTQADRMAATARQHALRHHSLSEMARRHRELFQDLMNSSKRLVP